MFDANNFLQTSGLPPRQCQLPVPTSSNRFRYFIDGSLLPASLNRTCRDLIPALLQGSAGRIGRFKRKPRMTAYGAIPSNASCISRLCAWRWANGIATA
jgi:hypothetical protein